MGLITEKGWKCKDLGRNDFFPGLNCIEKYTCKEVMEQQLKNKKIEGISFVGLLELFIFTADCNYAFRITSFIQYI